MKEYRTLFALSGLMLSVVAAATRFNLVPLQLGGGMTMSGTIDTDSTQGVIHRANIKSWNIVVKSVSGFSYSRADTGNISYGVISDGVHLYVPTSPDGYTDGGMLGFYRNVYNQVRVADFTGAYVQGGEAIYSKGSAFDFLPLNQPNGILYEVGSVDMLKGNLFHLRVTDFGNGVTMFGTVETDGSQGVTKITDWNIAVQEVWTFTFTPSNSRVLSDTGIVADGQTLKVKPFEGGNGNEFSIGFGSLDKTAALLADFSWLPGGQAGYISPFGQFTTSPLPLDKDGNYVVARRSKAIVVGVTPY